MLPEPIDSATPLADWVLILPVALSLAGAALLLILRHYRGLHGPLAILVSAAVAACDLTLFQRVLTEGPLAMTMGNWPPPFGISFTADVIGAGFALLAAAMTVLVLAYALMDRPRSDDADGFHALVLLLLAGVSGSFLTGDLFNLYVWFEVMLIATFGLLVFRGRTVELDATVKYGVINLLATTFLLVGIGLLYGVLGTLSMADIFARASAADAVTLTPIAALLLLAFAIKAAAFPVNAWLPAAYHAPSPVVSALLAGLPTKVGVYALLRTLGMLLPMSRDTLAPALVTAATATLVIAPLGAIAETNLRRALGFFVIGGIGAALTGLALGSAAGLAGSTVYIAHAMATMTALYLVAGLIERATGEADTRRIGGLYAANSTLSILFLVLVLAAAGVPPFLGFWPKLLLLQGSIAATGAAGPILTGAILINAFLTLVAGARLWSHMFWRPGPVGVLAEMPNPALRPLTRREAGFGLTAVTVLTLGIALVGVLPERLLAAGYVAAADLLAPSRYVAAVGLGDSP